MNKKKLVTLLGSLLFLLLLGGCSKGNAADEKVTIYTNADEEPVEVIKNVLDQNGYKGKYNLQSFGTSELGGKLLAEGKNIEADLVTMSTFYLTSAQKKENMFKNLSCRWIPWRRFLITPPLLQCRKEPSSIIRT